VETVVLATRNKGKISELSELLSDYGLDVQGLDAFPRVGGVEETGATFEENALIKARAVAEATGLVALADDSGLEVDALGGAPGVRSARYAGPQATDPENNAMLLRNLAGVPEQERSARFRCVMAAVSPRGDTLVAHGTWEGVVTLEPRGDQGFGYDPLFFDPGLGRTSAQLSREEKNARSHRGKALRALLAQWPAFWARVNQ
jgi:XTP/dITP diphosphohydrolase